MTRLMQQLASVAVIRQPREIHETLRIDGILLEQERKQRIDGLPKYDPRYQLNLLCCVLERR